MATAVEDYFFTFLQANSVLEFVQMQKRVESLIDVVILFGEEGLVSRARDTNRLVR